MSHFSNNTINLVYDIWKACLIWIDKKILSFYSLFFLSIAFFSEIVLLFIISWGYCTDFIVPSGLLFFFYASCKTFYSSAKL